MVQGQVFLNGGGGGKEGGQFSYLNISSFFIFTFRNYFTLCKIVLCIWRKNFFSATIILWKKAILSCLKNPNKGGGGGLKIYFSDPSSPLEFLDLSLYLCKSQRKQVFTLGNSAKLCDNPGKFQR